MQENNIAVNHRGSFFQSIFLEFKRSTMITMAMQNKLNSWISMNLKKINFENILKISDFLVAKYVYYLANLYFYSKNSKKVLFIIIEFSGLLTYKAKIIKIKKKII